jgi:hypothetical protein
MTHEKHYGGNIAAVQKKSARMVQEKVSTISASNDGNSLTSAATDT